MQDPQIRDKVKKIEETLNKETIEEDRIVIESQEDIQEQVINEVEMHEIEKEKRIRKVKFKSDIQKIFYFFVFLFLLKLLASIF